MEIITELEYQGMQTILKVVCDDRGQYQMIEDFAAAFSSRFAIESTVSEFPPAASENVAIALDNWLRLRNSTVGDGDGVLGSFRPGMMENEQLQFILVTPLIVSFRPNRQKLHFLVGGPSLRKRESAEPE